MALYNSRGGAIYPYTWVTEPYYNGGPLRKGNRVTIEPRYTDESTAANAYFDDSGDYSPTGSYVDLSLEWPGNSSWYTYVGGASTQSAGSLGHPTDSYASGQRPFYETSSGTRWTVSIWMSAAVGSSPHPGVGVARTYLSILRNAAGSHQGGSFWNANAAGAQYSSPRVFMGMNKFHITGQSYGDTGYRDWVCIGNYLNASQPMNATDIRIINWGWGASNKSRINLQGLKFVWHCHPTNSDWSARDF